MDSHFPLSSEQLTVFLKQDEVHCHHCRCVCRHRLRVHPCNHVCSRKFSVRLVQTDSGMNLICPYPLLTQTCFHEQSTALQGHVLAGYKPIAPAAAPSAGGIPGFSGFGHVTGGTSAAVPAPAPVANAEPIFSGFGHATGQMGGNPSLIGKSFVSPAAAPAVAAPAVVAGPAFSGFGHATGQMGGNPSIMAAASSVQKKAPASSASYLKSL